MVKSFENRDLKCASDVSIMASLGRFDTEFLLYGSAIQEDDGNIYYYATTDQLRLYRHIQQARTKERYFLPMVSEKRRSPVPSGMKSSLLTRYKLELIQHMKHIYEPLLPRLQSFFHTPPNDNAYPFLQTFQDEIDGYFDDAKLQLFEGLVAMSFEGKILSLTHYQTLCQWIEQVRLQMSDDPLEEGTITRVFYGFAYEDNGTLRYLSNAQEMALVEKRHALQTQGHLMAPIVKRQYAMNQSHEIGSARKAFNNWLRTLENETFMQKVQHLHAMDGVIDKKALDTLAADVSTQSEAYAAICYYRAIWNDIENS